MTHPLFYDSPQLGTGRTHFPIARRPLPRGWRRTSRGDWVIFLPPNLEMPDQGWKIHVSASAASSADTLTRVWEYCVSREIPFKMVGSARDVFLRNMKYADRSSAGKMAAIYPGNEAAFERILRELDAALRGAEGPYILSDLRYGSGPLYVRYGGFTERFCPGGDGQPVLAIENGDGVLVPDVRSPVFTVPDWVRLPEFLQPHLDARNAVGFASMDYDITGALHFSNGGGVYTATDKRDGREVILKEARPHAGLSGDGSDAVARLQREYELMRRLDGLGIAAEAYACFQVGDHHFLAEEFIDGKTFNKCVVERYPLLVSDPGRETLAEYTDWVMSTCAGTERATKLMHSRDIVFHDLHMHNVILRPDSSAVVLIDFEAAGDVSRDKRTGLGNPGFTAPASRNGFEIDDYALACMRLSAFMPLTAILPLDRSKAEQIATAISTVFPVPDSFLAEAVAEIGRDAPPPERTADSVTREFEAAARSVARVSRPASVPRQARSPEDPDGTPWSRLSADLVAAIRASATPERTDRLFPGDIDQFRTPGGGLGLAYGAAGVLVALDEGAGVRVPEYEEWLLRRVKKAADDMPLGCWDGLSGIAWALGRLGHSDAAGRLASRCLSADWERLPPDFFGGLSGFGTALLELAGSGTGDSAALAGAGVRAAEIVADFLRHDDTDAAGLMHGKAGQALLLIRAYEHTREPGYLDAAAAAIAADLDRCVPDPDGGLQVDEGYRMMPYLATGSAGIGTVIDQFLAHRDDPDLARAADRIVISAGSTFYVQPGLFTGRAGLLYFLASRDGASPASPRVRDHVARLCWHAMPYSGGLAFPGDQLLRLSMDVGTGTAGVLLGLASALAPRGAAAPLITRTRAAPAGPADLPGRDPAHAGPSRGADQDRELARR
ncbi:MAG: class III lanthionine synthetase LanKC [Streptosporangiales bacterium]|nr:class III lanthionine synthetase LanKC [Streptosporangiales bacterium]